MGKASRRRKPALDEQDYYHGFLPREDLPQLLKENGDFLVRANEPAKIGIRETILSVMCNKDDKENGMKHFAMRRTKKTKKYKLDKLSFPTIIGLIGHHKERGTPVTEKVPGSILKNAIPRQDWELSHAKIDVGKAIGKGAFGDVHRGKLTLKTGRVVDVAIKCAKTGEASKENIRELMKEARIMRNFEHLNIVTLYGVVVEQEPLMIVMELVRGGSLDNYLRKHSAPLDDKLKKMCMGAAWGLEYIHFKNCIHLDIAARNCLYDDRTKTLKISDFGLSREGNFYQLTSAKKMPVKWLAPETLKTGRYTKESDVFAFGILVWEIYSDAAEPYDQMSNEEVHKKVMEGYRMPLPSEVPEKISALVIKHCWEGIAENRYIMAEICKEIQEIAGIIVDRDISKDETTTEDSREETVDGGSGNCRARSGRRRKRRHKKKKRNKTTR